jgi:peptidoglycan/LPS O-acetylase OafA/YrhL
VASGAVLLGLLLVGHSASWLWWTSAIVHSAYAWFFAALTVLALTSRETSFGHRVWTSGFLKFFGKYSYGIYVVHYALRPAFLALIRPDRLRAMLFGSRILELLVFAVLATALSVAAALLTWFALEKRFLKLKRFFEYVPPARSTIRQGEAA